MAAKKEDGYDKFLADVMATIPEDRRQEIEETLRSEPVSKVIREGVLARSDYSKAHDALRAERESFAQEARLARERIAGWQTWYAEESQKTKEYVDRLAAYEETYGELESDPRKPRAPQPRGMTKEEIESWFTSEIGKRDTAAISFADELTDLKMDHRDRFKERLNTQELIALATEKGLPLSAAYREYTAERVEAQRQKDLDERIAAAREEGRKEAMGSVKFPSLPGPSEPHITTFIGQTPKTSKDRVSDAVADFMQSVNGLQS